MFKIGQKVKIKKDSFLYNVLISNVGTVIRMYDHTMTELNGSYVYDVQMQKGKDVHVYVMLHSQLELINDFNLFDDV